MQLSKTQMLKSKKLTMQNMCLENVALKSEIEQMKFEFKKESINVEDNSLHHDFFPCDHYFKF